jgi:4-amino-4-deoxy-L-arabinose transferase-like glycosyltransferase
VPLLERLALAALLLLASVPRARELSATFDRGFGGYQGAFFAIAAVNYERLGLGAAQGYPVLNIDLPGGSVEAARERDEQWLVYSNHPPTMPLLAWAGAAALGPPGWQEAWRAKRSPPGLEGALRLPFLLLHLVGLLALWWVGRVAFGPQAALIALALTVFLPVSALYGTLVNYENPSLPFALFAVGCYGLYVRSGGPRALFGLGAGFLVGCSFTFAPAFFLPGLCLRSWCCKRWREGLLIALVGGAGALLPLLAHAALAEGLRESRPNAFEGPLWWRVRVLLEPLLDGSAPLSRWLGAQLEHAASAFGPLLFALAGIGLVVALLRALAPRFDGVCRRAEWPAQAAQPIDLALPLFCGGVLYLFAFYRHTLEEQWVFLLYLAPGAALLAARAIHCLSLPLQRLRGGIAPLVLVVGSVMLFSLVRFESWRAAERAPGPRDPGGLAQGPQAPLPATVGGQLAQLLPPGAVGLHPSVLGLHPAAAWYAWRSLLPLEDPRDLEQRRSLRRLIDGLGGQDEPLYLVLPDDPPESAAAQVEALRTDLGPAALAAAGWRAWPLD